MCQEKKGARLQSLVGWYGETGLLLSSRAVAGQWRQQPHNRIYALTHYQLPCRQAFPSPSHPFPRQHLSGLYHVQSTESGTDGTA